VRCSGDSTKAPSPCRASTMPSARSWATASRTTLRLTPNVSASCCSVGSRAPGLKSPASMPRLISWATRLGKVSATPVKTDFGYHVIRLDDVRPLTVPPFNEMRQQFMQRAQQQQIQKLVMELRQKAKIEER